MIEFGMEDDVYVIFIVVVFGGIVGGKFYYVIFYGDLGLFLNWVGIVYYGGFIGGVIVVLVMMIVCGMLFWRVIDVMVFVVVIGYVVGCLGCLVVGDDYGVLIDLLWVMVFFEGLILMIVGVMCYYFDVDIVVSVFVDILLKVYLM